MILLHYYILNVPISLALNLAGKEDYMNNKIPYLFDNEAYDNTGLTNHFIDGYDNII